MSAPADKIVTTLPTRRVLVVLGMHRSGTSAVAGCLQRLGVDFGPRLMPPTEDNARGYFEHIDVVNLHDRLLLALGGGWDETCPLPDVWWEQSAPVETYRSEMLGLLNRDFPAAPLWGLKDPRLCRLLPWWEPLWKATNSRPLFVIVRRPPAEVAASLTRREGFSAAKSQLLWLQHVMAAERDTRGHQRVWVNFQDFLMDSRQALTPVREALDQPWPSEGAPDTGVAAEFIDRTLSRSSTPTDAIPLSPWLVQADGAVQAGLAGRETEMRAVLDVLAVNVRAAQSLFTPSTEATVTDLRHQLETTRCQGRWYEEEWQKARHRTQRAEEKSARCQTKLDELDARVIKNAPQLSKLRKNKLSNMRKSGSSWAAKLGKIFHLL